MRLFFFLLLAGARGQQVIPPSTTYFASDGIWATAAFFDSGGEGPVRFNFRTSDLAEYQDTSITSATQLRIVVHFASFEEVSDCANVYDATGSLPALDTCYFSPNEAKIKLQTRLLPNTLYSITVKVRMPTMEMPDANGNKNTFDFITEFYQLKEIERSRAPIELTKKVKLNAESFQTPNTNGWVTSFTLISQESYVASTATNTIQQNFVFAMSSTGTMSEDLHVIDVIAHPTNVWRLGTPGAPCQGYTSLRLISGSSCVLQAYPGSSPDQANGFQIIVGSTPAVALSNSQFQVRLPNPTQPVNMVWVAQSSHIAVLTVGEYPRSVVLASPVHIVALPQGQLSSWETEAVSAEQWVTLELYPGNSVQPFRPSKETSGTKAGSIIITPPSGFLVIESVPPQNVGPDVNSFTGTWTVDVASNSWILDIIQTTAFADSLYQVNLKVTNPSTAAPAAIAWQVIVQDASEPFPNIISASRDIRGMAVFGQMAAALAHQNQLYGATNLLRFTLTPGQSLNRVFNAQILIYAPSGFVFQKRCPQLSLVQGIAADVVCKGSESSYFSLTFPSMNSIIAGTEMIVEVEVDNPASSAASSSSGINVNSWSFYTKRPDGVGIDVASFQGFDLYPQSFSSFQIIPASRLEGAQNVVVRFVPASAVPYDDFIRVRAPEGINWVSSNLMFSTKNSDTDALTFNASTPVVPANTPNWIFLQVLTNLEPDFEYGFRGRVMIPALTPIPNKWWLEQYRLTGATDRPYEFIASVGTEGFKTQVLVSVSVNPYNLVAEAWENPTTIVFETTAEALPVDAIGSTSAQPAEFRLQGPPGFTFICPPREAASNLGLFLPEPIECVVHHTVEEERNILHIYLRESGLDKNTRYAFIVNMVNAEFVNPTTNYFILETRVGEDLITGGNAATSTLIESKIIAGVQLTQRMTSTEYISLPTREDRRAGVSDNQLTFSMGLTADMAAGWVLELTAPVGFNLARDGIGTCMIEGAQYMGSSYSSFPGVTSLSCLTTFDNVATLTVSAAAPIGRYALSVMVANPFFTPSHNYWQMKLLDTTGGTPVMSESWISGFSIQEVTDTLIYPYNPSNAIPGEAAPNPIDVFFTLTTQLPSSNSDTTGGQIKVSAPVGFYFPPVCRDFFMDIGSSVAGSLPAGTRCSGDGGQTIFLNTPANSFLQPGAYAFRVMVENPSQPFRDPTISEKLWSITTFLSDGTTLIDFNNRVVGFDVRQRASYFTVQALNAVGLFRTSIKVSFSLYGDLLPQSSIYVFSPLELVFEMVGEPCLSPEPHQTTSRPGEVLTVDVQSLRAEFGASLLSDVAQLPEYVSCTVDGPNQLLLRNEENVRAGRPLLSGPTYEQMVTNAINPQSTPNLNLWRLEAYTSHEFAPESWAASGYKIFPELINTAVTSSNPGYGLFTIFTFSLRTITAVPEGGSIKVEAPPVEGPGFYFGPRLSDPSIVVDPLSTIPPPAGNVMPRPSGFGTADEPGIACEIVPPVDTSGSSLPWTCPLAFTPCLKIDEINLALLINPSAVTEDPQTYRPACDELTSKCDLADFHSGGVTTDQLLYCESRSGLLEVTLGLETRIPAGQSLSFAVTGYNGDLPSSREWEFVTRNADSSKTPLDRKTVIGFEMLGVVFVDLISPSETRVSVSENIVEVHLRLSSQVPPPARLNVEYPSEFGQDTATIREVTTSGAFPRKVDWRFNNNQVQVDTRDEPLRRDVTLIMHITLSNPPISPSDARNIWRFETLSLHPETLYNKSDVNFDVPGFRIYGNFRRASTVARIRSPTVRNTVGIWFVLESDLPKDDANPTSFLRIWFPPGFLPPDEACGVNEFNLEYQRYVGSEEFFPIDKAFVSLPGGTICSSFVEPSRDRLLFKLQIDRTLEYGLDYAFQVGVMNARNQPSAEENSLQFETQMAEVILHLFAAVPSFELTQLHFVDISPQSTTQGEPLNLLTISLQSIKELVGNTFIRITAPSGFLFTCAFVEYVALAPTTTCTPQNNIAEFQLDTGDEKLPNFRFQILVYVRNPEFTPQPNLWKVDMIAPLGNHLDIRLDIPGFDVTGLLEALIFPRFTYKAQRNLLSIRFVPGTIMNRADVGNELLLEAPAGYRFPRNCTGFTMQPVESAIDGYPIPSDYIFPPPGTLCAGYDNETVTVRFPSGSGLQKYYYVLTVEVVNALFNPNTTSSNPQPPVWTFKTRVNDPANQVFRIVDANISVPGFWLEDLESIDQSSAWGLQGGLVGLAALCSVLLG